MKKPPGLIYGVDDVPPLAVTVLSGLQHVGLISIFLLFPLLVFREAGLSSDALGDVLSLSMIAMAVGAVLPALRAGPVGAGFLCPQVFTAFYLGPSLLAVKAGGIALVAGMTIFAGVVEALLAGIQRHLRPYFPPEVAGFVVLMLGVNIGTIGVRHALTGAEGQPSESLEILIALLSLGTMIALSIWTRGAMRMFSALVGMVAGYVGAGIIGVLDAGALGRVTGAPLISAPSLGHLGLSWDATFIIPFALGALAACLKTVGCLTTCQKINDADWVRPEMRSAGRGVMADAVGTMGAGLLGTLGMNSSPASVGVSGATGVTSRRVAYAIAMIFLVLAFMPKVAAVFSIMPRPVIGATLLFSACFVIINGQEIIASRLLDTRRTFVIGLSFMVGLSVELVPAYFVSLPPNYQPVLGSSLVLGMLCALFLNLLFRLGTWRTGRLTLELDKRDSARVVEFMEAQGAAWGARRDVIDRARFSLAQSIETIVEGCDPQGPLEIETAFDEFNVDVRVSYPGAPLELPEQRPTNEEIMQSEEGQRRLAGFMLRRQADSVAATHRAGRSTILFHFDH